MWSEVEGLLGQALSDGVAPGMALCVRSVEAELFVLEAGAAELRPCPRPVTTDQPWDLASLTKVLATTPVALSLVDRLGIGLDFPVAKALSGAPEGMLLRHLLQHDSGLPAWTPYFEEVVAQGLTWGTAHTRRAVMDRALTTPLEAAPGARHRYSDLGMLVLGRLLEELSGARVDQLFDHLACPADLRWGWPGAAATEDCPVRKRVVVGEVHDLNAAVMGGRAPHAGLFGSVRAVAQAAAWQLRAFRGEAVGLPCGLMRQAWTTGGCGSHRLGWDGVSPGACTAGERWPLDGVGHTGFTGCVVWVAPRQGVVVSLLSNRVHPLIEGGAVPDAPVVPRLAAWRALRPALFTAIVGALEGAGMWREA